MATAWADVVSAALIQIDDIRLTEQMQTSPAQFYRRMAAVIRQATPLLSRPPELTDYLAAGTTEPSFDDSEWTSTEESTAEETVVETGKTGYELCSCVLRIPQQNGTVALAPYAVSYDPETGNVTFPAQDAANLSYELDFYSDGAFPTLTDSQMRLFALAIAVVWDERFSRNWLNLQAKIHDESFSTVNEANYMQQVTKRLHDNRISFNDELRWYEQRVAYNTAFNSRMTGVQNALI